MDDMSEIIQEFLVESHENLDQLDRDLVALERAPDSHDLLSRIFRTIHTIKGTSGFLAFNRLESLTHAGESLLARLRDGVQALTPSSTDALLRMVDTVRVLLSVIETTGGEGDVAVEPVVAAVTACIASGSAPTDLEEAVPATGTPDPDATAATAAGPEPGPGPEPGAATDETPADPEPAAAPAGPPDHTGGTGRRSVADSSIRVDVTLLDALMRLVGELVLTRNQLLRGVNDLADPALTRAGQRLNLITSELQESVMKTRMQPIDHLWAKLPRVVRDLSGAFGKQVRLAMVGRETELDRTLLEAVKDPLTHLVRNAIDHGVESPDVRRARGKDPEGTLTLRAYHEGGHIVVEIADDGAGIDPDRIAATAMERGVVTRDRLSRMDSREIISLVFEPGFSTAETVTNVSGRGVGMDVVKTNIERIGGAVDVESTVGHGTTWRLTIPLTLAIIQALTVECGPERYVIPQVAVHELVTVDGQSGPGIEQVSGAPVYRLRGRLLPLVRLDETLGLPAGAGQRTAYIAVLQAEGRLFGLVVDRVLNTEEIVVKPLSSRLKDIGLYAGATILGDGKVALILDIQSLARRSHVAAEATPQAVEPASRAATGTGERLLITALGERRVAIPLAMVTRLEEFEADRIERVGHREVVQYRGEILPVVRLATLLGTAPFGGDSPGGATVPAVVYTEQGRSVALAVERILDIVEDGGDARSDIDDACLIGSAVIQQRVTELLDVRRAILAADPDFFSGDPVADRAELMTVGVP
jgi:two-component system chemotaxis sensor kinase CheA